MVRKPEWLDPTMEMVPDDHPSVPSLSPSGGVSILPPSNTAHVVANRYEIIGLLGSGGMGVVYKARDRELNEVVALKMIRGELSATPDVLARFRQEVRLARRVTHANVARSYDFGVVDGVTFLTMEFIEGRLLSDLASEGALAVPLVAQLARGIARGLEAAHAAGIVHRDLKPENILLRNGHEPVITDFGVAFSLADARATAGGIVVGTPAYMSPEQVEGSDHIDGRADQYALGAMLYELLTGDLPFIANGVFATALLRLTSPAPDPRAKRPEIPDGIASIVLRCMERKPADRFPNMAAVGQALDALSEIHSRPPPEMRAGTMRESTGLTVAIAPFRVVGVAEDVAQIYAEELADRLAESRSIRVRTGAFTSRRESPVEFGKRVGVAAVIHGSISERDDKITLSLRLSVVRDNFQIWARRFSRAKEGLNELLDEAAREIHVAFGHTTETKTTNSVEDATAFELYVKGRQALWRFTSEGTSEASGFFRRALEISPDNPAILSSYATALCRSFLLLNNNEVASKAGRELAERAMLLAPDRAEPRVAMAAASLQMCDFLQAARYIRDALERAPESAEAHELAARMLAETLDLPAFLAHMEAALYNQPRFIWMQRVEARTRALHGDWEDAERMIALTQDQADGINYWGTVLRLCVWRNGNIAPPDVDFSTMKSLTPFERVMMSHTLDFVRTRKAATGGPLDILRQQLEGMQEANRSRAFLLQLIAESAAYVGDLDGAVDAIRQAGAAGLFDALWLERCPILESARARPELVSVRETVRQRAEDVRMILVMQR